MTTYGSNVIPTMTSNSAPAGVASCVSEQAGHEAYRAFDHVKTAANYVYNQDTPAAGGVFFRYGHAVAKTVAMYKIKTLDLGGESYPNTWTFRGAQTAADGSALDTRGPLALVDNTEYTYEFTNVTAYAYNTLRVTKTGSGAGVTNDFCAITELEMYELATPAAGGANNLGGSGVGF